MRLNFEQALLFAQLLKGLIFIFATDSHQNANFRTGEFVHQKVELRNEKVVIEFIWNYGQGFSWIEFKKDGKVIGRFDFEV